MVVEGFAPGFDVGGVYDGVAGGGEHADAADGAAVVVERDNGPPEALVADGVFHLGEGC